MFIGKACEVFVGLFRICIGMGKRQPMAHHSVNWLLECQCTDWATIGWSAIFLASGRVVHYFETHNGDYTKTDGIPERG
jgi:hypothetical protein